MAAAARGCTHWPQTDGTCTDGDRWWLHPVLAERPGPGRCLARSCWRLSHRPTIAP